MMIYAVNKRTKEHKLTNLSEYNMNMYPHSQYKIIEADANGWIKWRGVNQPLPDGERVELMIRGNGEAYTVTAYTDHHRWTNRGYYSDIIAYRPILNDKPQWVPEVGEAVRHPTGKGVVMLPPDVNGVIIVLSSDGDTEGEYKRVAAIACRSITTQEDRAVEEMYRDAQLADCVGFTQGMAQALCRAGYRKQKHPEEDTGDRAH